MGICPRIEIDLNKIKHNAIVLQKLYGEKGIEITGVIKGVCASPIIANVLVESGITHIADSKIENLKKMKKASVDATFVLIRTPSMSEIRDVVQYADISMNTELDVVRALSREAVRRGKTHQIIIMVEMGDLREGVLPVNVPAFIQQVLPLPGIEIVGVGTNFACFSGIVPTKENMRIFSRLVQKLRRQFHIKLPIISGGNSANFQWVMHTKDVGTVNHIRIGESLFLGRDTVNGEIIPHLYPDAFRFIAEVIESKVKPSVPKGIRGKNAFGEKMAYKDRGKIRRAILGVGRQDVFVPGLTPIRPFEILGASSDHIVLNTRNIMLKPGDEVAFFPNYGAMLASMTSPYVYKKYIRTQTQIENKPLKTTASLVK